MTSNQQNYPPTTLNTTTNSSNPPLRILQDATNTGGSNAVVSPIPVLPPFTIPVPNPVA
eukprot:CAMPEP_0196804122 /NCGR_PEP_ID=MMETSP1362-20130617/3636_1 /TAXON_ID=163516 /ORGANISM="Leptocylindrus danicus, Strain CCMP1856" /LENGTH=58 /DNA_ID=CAMNT_0042176153 /DNA_START=18 /DNA_END=190 /DNA_ORIENTATION=+